MNHLLQTRLRKELELFALSGIGLPAAAPSIAALVRRIVGADNCVLAWDYSTGVPAGGYSEVTTPAIKNRFTNDYRRLFTGEHELNSAWLASLRGRPCGVMLKPDRRYWRSNSFNLLIKDANLHHALDLRIDVGERTHAVLGLFRSESSPFDASDAERLSGLLPLLQRCAHRLDHDDEGSRQVGHLLFDASGATVELADEGAQAILRDVNLAGCRIEADGSITRPPDRIEALLATFREDPARAHACDVEVPGGALRAIASRMASAASSASGTRVLVTLERRTPGALRIVASISRLNLSPIQNRIAWFAAAGGRRDDCARQLKLHRETLKTHLRAVYGATGSDDWDTLAATLKRAALTTP